MTWGLGAVEQTLGERYNRAEMRHKWRETVGNEGGLTSLVSRLNVARRLQFSIIPTLRPHRYVVVVVIVVPFADIVHLGQDVT